MGRLVVAFGSSHSIMLVSTREDWIEKFRATDRRMPLYDRQGNTLSYDDLLAMAPPGAPEMVTPEKMKLAFDRTEDAVAKLRRDIEAAEIDALIIVGDDQHELFQDTLMPPLAIYYGDTIRNAGHPGDSPGDWYHQAQLRRREPDGDIHYPCHGALGLHLLTGLSAREFDVTAVKGLAADQFEGHAYSYIHRTYLQKRKNLPVVPLFLNTYYPPNPPRPSRCVALGRHLAELIDSYPSELRVGIIASGGLSHFVVDEELDRAVLKAFETRDLDYLAGIDPERLKAGSSEIRSWMVTAAAAAASDLDLAWSCYIPAYRTPALTGTGLGFACWS